MVVPITKTAVFGSSRTFVPGMLDFGEPNTERYYTIPHADVLDLKVATGWALGMFFRIPSNAGSNFRYMLNTATSGASRVAMWVAEASSSGGGNVNTINAAVQGDSVGTLALQSNSTTVADNIIRLAVLQHDTVNTQLYVCSIGKKPSLVQGTTNSLGDITPVNNWHVGARLDLLSTRFFEGDLGGFFKVDRALTLAEIQAIAKGMTPKMLSSALAGYWLFSSALATVPDEVSTNDATRAGTGW